MAGGVEQMTYKEKARRDIDRHIARGTGGRGKMKGSKPAAWAEVKALARIMEANSTKDK